MITGIDRKLVLAWCLSAANLLAQPEILDNSYTIAYDPDPLNQNQGFRKIRIEIVQDVGPGLRI